MNGKVDTSAGKFSVVVAILGIVAAVVCFIIPSVFTGVDRMLSYRIGMTALAACGVLALLLGIVGRKSSTGRSGIAISLIALVLALIYIVFNYGTQPDVEGGQPANVGSAAAN